MFFKNGMACAVKCNLELCCSPDFRISAPLINQVVWWVLRPGGPPGPPPPASWPGSLLLACRPRRLSTFSSAAAVKPSRAGGRACAGVACLCSSPALPPPSFPPSFPPLIRPLPSFTEHCTGRGTRCGTPGSQSPPPSPASVTGGPSPF